MTVLLTAAKSNDALVRDAVRARALSVFEELGMPTTSDEVWRYAPLDKLRLLELSPAQPVGLSSTSLSSGVAASCRGRVNVSAGQLLSAESLPPGVSVSVEPVVTTIRGAAITDRYHDDSITMLAHALAPGVVTVRVARGTTLSEPLLLSQHEGPGVSATLWRVVVEEGARATVIHLLEGAAQGAVLEVVESDVHDRAHLEFVTYQRLDDTAWFLARSTGVIAQDAELRQSVIGLGAAYDRHRCDAELIGTGAHNELRTTYLGSGSRIHDVRTHQRHESPRTTSVLLSKGAVSDESRSVYTGLIEIEKGAKKTDARQTNHNLLLSPHAHADSVPNLDIKENDVVCAHASSVGPLDELQLWYLASRGVPPQEAENLIIQGFFLEMLEVLPADVRQVVEADVATALAAVRGRA